MRTAPPAAVYDKYRLVPFGEYIPFAGLVARLGIPAPDHADRRRLLAGAGAAARRRWTGVPPFLPLICYEAIFPRGECGRRRARPEWLVQITNDAWFGEASGPFQHLTQARVRAIEQGLPLARAANTGSRAMIDAIRPRRRERSVWANRGPLMRPCRRPCRLPPIPVSGDLLALIAICRNIDVNCFNLLRWQCFGRPPIT